MKKIIFLFLLTLFSCNSTTQKKQKNAKKHKIEDVVKDPIIIGGKYFDYDEIDYYQSDVMELDLLYLNKSQKLSKEDSLKKGVFLDEIPKSVNDIEFIGYLKTFGYKKSKIKPEKFDKIDEVFTEKKHFESYVSACVYVYRDILIFKKQLKIVGIAKICFGCGANIIVGTKANTTDFGMSGDYDRLMNLLREK